ncbi:hypothetical protein G6O69_20685 [Pseudenhygromyxa sp. WMMC2535]|uniref:hypothetical protein n=1 Tax=Pseudenhygromyxa sp. WMMC2535 TaxID=2712867 RepID=UPI001553EACF|nr:hypothetical protein [Pseudenhygromyxa sp. WMMC2535]NVB40271.1 hypothetical protein [Pseudenhygromyxa sp. WMMC2535]
MAYIDNDRNLVVLRIVYDGLPRAGKTASLHSLGASLRREVETPAEAEGRTLMFDWLDYEGGSFEGRSIRCQVIAVPGQRALDSRRRFLLREADAVIEVVDTEASRFDEGVEFAEGAIAELASHEPPVGVVLQANKLDLPGSVGIDTVRERMGEVGTVAIVGTSATSGTGVRAAFVLGVRLALDRLRAQSLSDASEVLQVDDAEALRAAMEAAELERAQARASAAEPRPPLRESIDHSRFPGARPLAPLHLRSIEGLGQPAAAAESQARMARHEQPPQLEVRDDSRPPALPHPGLDGGTIWPPVHGRVHLRELADTLGALERGEGGWVATSKAGWRAQTEDGDRFADERGGRDALISMARVHVRHAAHLSERRVLALVPDEGCWRLWGAAHSERSAGDMLREAAEREDEALVGRALQSLVLGWLALSRELAPTAGALTLDRLGWRGDRLVFAGVLPRVPPEDPPEDALLLFEGRVREQLASLLRTEVTKRELSVPEVLHHFQPASVDGPGQRQLVEVVSGMLIER